MFMLWPLAILIPVTIILFVCLLDTVYITIQIYPCDIINENGEMVHIKRLFMCLEWTNIKSMVFL
jgi:hypothetical protein